LKVVIRGGDVGQKVCSITNYGSLQVLKLLKLKTNNQSTRHKRKDNAGKQRNCTQRYRKIKLKCAKQPFKRKLSQAQIKNHKVNELEETSALVYTDMLFKIVCYINSTTH